MKTLSIKQPWASLIAHGIKDIENRTWKTHFRGKIYIHASAKHAGDPRDLLTDEQWKDMASKVFMRQPSFSAIIGEVEIIDCVINHPSIWAEKMETHVCEETGIKILNKNQKYIWNWVLANPVLYEKPILNVKGKLSFWEPDVDIVKCIGCSQKFDVETMQEDDSEEKFCSECWNELSPIMEREAKEVENIEKPNSLIK